MIHFTPCIGMRMEVQKTPSLSSRGEKQIPDEKRYLRGKQKRAPRGGSINPAGLSSNKNLHTVTSLIVKNVYSPRCFQETAYLISPS